MRYWVGVLVLLLFGPLGVSAQEALQALQTQASSGAGRSAPVAQATLATVQVTVTAGFNRTVTFQASVNGQNYVTIGCVNTQTLAVETTATAAGTWVCPVVGQARLATPLSGGSTGTATVEARMSSPAVNPFAVGSSTGGSSTGDVTHTGSFTANHLIIGSGAADISDAGALSGLVKANGASAPTAVAAPTSAVAGISDTQALSNKRVIKRVGTTTSSATPTINTDNVDVFTITAQSGDITSFTTNLSGVPTDGQTLLVSITATGTINITWGASFEASTIALPIATVSTARLDVLFVWNVATTKWRCIGVA